MKPIVAILNRLDLVEFPYHEWLRGYPVDVVLFCDQQVLEREENQVAMQSYSKVFTYANYATNGAIEYDVLKLAETSQVIAVGAISEVDVLRAARLRDVLGLGVGQAEIVHAMRDKLSMKKVATECGISVPAFFEISNGSQVFEVAAKLSLPFIVKPRTMGGSMGVQKITSDEDLRSFLSRSTFQPIVDQASGWMAEELVPHPMIHADGFYDGVQISQFLAYQYIGTGLDFSTGFVDGSLSLPDTDWRFIQSEKAIQSFLKKIGANFPFAFHVEFFADSDSQCLKLCEIACRPGGGRLMDLFSLGANKFSQPQYQIVAQLPKSLRPQMPARKNADCPVGALHLPGRQGMIKSINFENQPRCITDVKVKVKVGDQIESAKHSADDIASCLLAFDDADDDLLDQVAEAQKWLSSCVVIETGEQ